MEMFVLQGDMGVCLVFFFQAEAGIRVLTVTGVRTCALPIPKAPPMSPPRPVRSLGASPLAPPSLDPEARFEAMVHAHYARLGAFARRLVGSRPAAEDVVHEVLLRVWRSRASFSFDTALPYLYQAVRNEATSWRPRQGLLQQRTPGAVDSAAQPDRRPDAQRRVELSELARAVEETVAALPERRREIFRMQREQGLTYAQIASLLAISIKTVEVQMGRALKAIRLRAAPFLMLTIAP